MKLRPRVSTCLCMLSVLLASSPHPAASREVTLPAEDVAAHHIAAQLLLGHDGAPATATQDAGSGAIRALRGADVALAFGREAPAEALRAWVADHGAAFGLEPADNVRIERSEPLGDGRTRVQLRQYWHGVPVEGGDARGIVDASGRLRFLAVNFLSGVRAADVPESGAEAAELAVARILGGAPAGAPALWIRRRDDGDRLAWCVRRVLAEGRVARSWVDARTGEVLATDDDVAHAVGLVFPSDPASPLAEVALPRLVSGPGLVSHRVGVVDILNPEVVPLGPDGDYRYPPSHPSFDQVNVYWHADHFLVDFLGALGYAGPPESLVVRANAATEPFAAQTSGRYIALGRPIAGFVQDVSRSQDIIYHELTHGVLYGFGILPTGPNREAAAFHEGLADYFAASLTGDPGIGQWLYLTFPNGATRVDQPVDPWNYDHYDHVSYSGGEMGSPWGNGMILSSALWDLRAVLGASADSLVLESLVYLPEEPVWSQFANALLQADAERHGGRLQADIVRTLSARRIRGAVEAGIDGPAQLAVGAAGTFRALPCCGGVLGSYHWRVRTWCRGRPCSEWTDLADGPELRVAFEEDSELQLTVATPWADTLTAALHYVGVRPPELTLSGPERIVQHGTGTWSARFAAMGPAVVLWSRTWRRPFSVPVTFARTLDVSFAADTSCDLDVALIDGLGRRVTRRLSVETFADRPPSDRTARLLVRQRFDARMQRAELTMELVQPAPVSAVIYDVRGRERVRIWDGPLGIGTHVVRWDAGTLEPGVYFLRVTTEPAGTVLRFAVLR